MKLAVLAWTKNSWFHFYIFESHYLENVLNCIENCFLYFQADLVEMLLFNAVHIDVDLKMLCAVHHCYCDGKRGIVECDYVVRKTLW